MAKYHRLLVGVDGSEASFHALREAFKLAGNWVTVVAVAPSYVGDLGLVGAPGAERLRYAPCDTALARAQELAAAAGAVIQTVCAVGEPHAGLVEQAEKGSRDLIVLGAKGHSYLERVLVGSVTQRVIGFTGKDVLVVPLAAAVGWERILLATDGSPHSRAAEDRALELARDYAGALTALAVIGTAAGFREAAQELSEAGRRQGQGLVEEVADRAGEMGLPIQTQVRAGKAYEVIVQVAREEQADLIVMGSHGRSGLARLLLGRVTERVIGQAPCPVLVVKPQGTP